MTFFQSNSAHNEGQLLRKRSFSRERPTGDKLSDETSMLRHSPSASIPSPSAAGPRQFPPPLSTPVSEGKSPPGGSTQPDKPPAKPILYEQPSMHSKTSKRHSPSFSNISICVPRQTIARPPPSTSSARDKRTETESGDQTDTSGSLASRATPHPTKQGPFPPRSHSTSVRDSTPSEFPRSKSHSPVRSRSTASASARIFKPNLDLKARIPPEAPGTLSPTSPTDVSPSRSMNLPSHETPGAHPKLIPPNQSHGVTRAESSSKPRSHSRTPSFPPPTSETSKWSRGYACIRPLEVEDLQPSLQTAPASGSRSPTLASLKHQDKGVNNVLRKSSVSKRDTSSAPTSDSERKTKAYRPRTRSVFASMRRNSSSNLFEFIKPPAPTTSLTPAGDILVAYKEKDLRLNQPIGSLRKTSFESTGKLIAIGTPDDDLKSPWSPGWHSLRSHHEDAGDVGQKVRGLGRKLSERLGGKDLERTRRAEGERRGTSGEVVEQSQEKSRRLTSVKRSPSFRKETKVYISPTSGLDSDTTPQSGWSQETDEGEGRVWEEDVGDWALGHIQSREVSDSPSPSRLWKLVKRFSSGNLKDKPSPPLEAPPPVPQLPKHITLAQWTSPGDIDADEMPIPQTSVPDSPGGIMRYITSVPSLSIQRVKHARSVSAYRRADSRSSVPAGPHTSDMSTHATKRAGTRRNTTANSSSLNPGDTKVFPRSRSSSDSSYGEAVPPMLNPPHDPRQKMGGGDLATAHAPLGDPSTSHNVSTHETPVSSSSSPTESSVASATIPKFDVRHPSNNFAPYKGKKFVNHPTSPTTHFPETQPLVPRAKEKALPRPPRPARNPHRPNSISTSAPQPLWQKSLPDVIPVQETLESGAVDVDMDAHQRQPSLTKLRKAHPRSVSDGAVMSDPLKSPGTAHSQLTFREITATKRPLTEQEKNAKWEDLLQRSEMAGGTLHLGSQAAGGLSLWSDRSSVAPSESLNVF